ncbi:MAG TPA: hypothetical protein VEH79_03720, partial [Gaiellaceae bacterium]|nr:hypothetical protein [Gaiellaceae bacterium]
MRQRDDDLTLAERLGHVAPVREQELEHASNRGRAANAKRARLHPSHDLPRSAHDDHHADPHPHGDSRRPKRSRRHEHQRIVIAGLRAEGQPRGNGQHAGLTGPERESARTQR